MPLVFTSTAAVNPGSSPKSHQPGARSLLLARLPPGLLHGRSLGPPHLELGQRDTGAGHRTENQRHLVML